MGGVRSQFARFSWGLLGPGGAVPGGDIVLWVGFATHLHGSPGFGSRRGCSGELLRLPQSKLYSVAGGKKEFVFD